MTGKITQTDFNKIIEQDIEWLEYVICEPTKQTSLEFDHIVNTLRYAAKQHSNNLKCVDELTKTT